MARSPISATDELLFIFSYDVIRAADEGKVTCLVLLDLSSAFDTVDHDLLLNALRRRLLVEEPVVKWFHSYLNDRMQVITVDGKEFALHPPCLVQCSTGFCARAGPVHLVL